MMQLTFLTTFLVTTLLLVSPLHWSFPVKAQPADSDTNTPSSRFDDTIIVKYKEESFHEWNPVQRMLKMKSLAGDMNDVQELSGLTVLRTLPNLGIQQFKLGPNQSLNSVIRSLRTHSPIQYAEYNLRVIATEDPPPNDRYWLNNNLWGLTRISMTNAWAYRTDASSIVVAVIDSGIDYDHLDLNSNIWTDSETQAHGINACVREHNSAATDPMDMNGHGSMVAGIIGAKGNNDDGDFKKGVGVSWEVKLLAARFLCNGGPGSIPDGSVADAIAAIEYAIEHHVDIINNSWRVIPPVHQDEIQILRGAVKRTNCQSESDSIPLPHDCKRALFVAAAGNWHRDDGSLNSDEDNGKVYPANFSISNIIAVAATDANDNLWDNSHYGVNSVQIAAPGVDINSTNLRTIGDGFSADSGTSMAAPHVAGCAALLQAQSLATTGSPRSIESLRDKLLNSADHVAALDSYIANGRRLNCGNALHIASPPPDVRCLVTLLCNPDQILVQFKPGTDSSRVNKLNQLLGVEVVKTLEDGQVVKIPTGKSREEIRRAYSAFPEVKSVTFAQ